MEDPIIKENDIVSFETQTGKKLGVVKTIDYDIDQNKIILTLQSNGTEYIIDDNYDLLSKNDALQELRNRIM